VTPLPDDLLRLTDICVPNETELELLSGSLIADLGVEVAARALQKRGPHVVVVTLGAAGAMVVSETVERMPGLQVDAVDPTGAGDVFIGALAVYLSEGKDLREAVRWANAAGALSVTRSGAQSAAPSRGEVEAMLRHDEPRT
jgi:ribokinase